MNNEPIVIGAVGGSGTRVFAEILQKCNVYIGNELNGALDNLIFSRLFRIPSFYSDTLDSFTFKRLSLFKKYMTNEWLSLNDFAIMYNCNKKNQYYRNTISSYYNLLRSRPKTETWGWKAPVSQLYIKPLTVFFPRIKYIQIVRNGLDMAFSSNVNQLRIWGHLFDLTYEEKDREIPSKLLKYWYYSNKKTIETGRKLGERFLVINFEDFCKYPEIQVPKMIDFLDLEVSKKDLNEIIQLPKLPQSVNRHLEKNYSFSNEELSYVHEIKEMIENGQNLSKTN